MDIPLYKYPSANEESNILAYVVKHTKYCNYSTRELNTIILYLLVDLVHIYNVLSCGWHTSLNIDFSRWVQMDPPPRALTCGHIANYHNPMHPLQLSPTDISLIIIMHLYGNQYLF